MLPSSLSTIFGFVFILRETARAVAGISYSGDVLRKKKGILCFSFPKLRKLPTHSSAVSLSHQPKCVHILVSQPWLANNRIILKLIRPASALGVESDFPETHGFGEE